jgi:four helix bundle protein
MVEFFIFLSFLKGTMKENIIQIKTLEFSIRLSRLYVILKDKKYYEIASQFFRSGTSMGTNVAEAQ